ncbi:MAG: GAF domain-containing protein [Deltaproteobacteria bacterium]|nr:MAG: GAF domain-containing protein [Deltaproteobacteria bacterium]
MRQSDCFYRDVGEKKEHAAVEEKQQKQRSIVAKSAPGQALAQWMQTHRFTGTEVLQILGRAGEALETWHDRGAVYGQVSSETMVWSRETGAVQLLLMTDEDEAGVGKRQRSGSVEHSLLYIAPEQTGRLELAVDLRADLYSLGAVAWHLLVGRPPFVSKEPQALIHAHLASRPEPPHHHREDIPLFLSEVILKLMAKQPEERYQTVRGLKFDLQRYAEALEKEQATHFALGQYDKFVLALRDIPLCGRSSEIQLLRDALVTAQEGALSFVLIGGAPGVGKTTLAKWLSEPTHRMNGTFVRGRFELFQADVPFHAFQTALQQVLVTLLAEERPRLLYWRARLKQELGNNDGVLCSLLPALRPLLGEVSEVPVLPPRESRLRMQSAFTGLLQALASPVHPLVMFLDDLQWADSASLELLEYVATHSKLKGLVLVGGYRDVEAGQDSLFPAFLTTVEERNIAATTITLEPLDVAAVTELLGVVCGCPEEHVRPLAGLLWEKTAGNPFFLQTLLQQAYREKLLWADGSGWSWDEEKLQAIAVTDNVVMLLLSSLQQQPVALQEALRYAACLGHFFSVTELMSLLQVTEDEVRDRLRSCVEEGLLIAAKDTAYRFSHDRVQEAAYALMTEDEKAATHLKVGRFLLDKYSESGNVELLYDIVSHIQQSPAEELSHAERLQLADLALKAGRQSQQAGAFESAFGVLQWGCSLLGESRWEEHYEVTRTLVSVIAEVGPACRDREQVEPFLDELLTHGRTLEDQFPAWESRSLALIADSKMREAIDVINRFFALTKTPPVEVIHPLKLAWSVLKTFWLLGRRKPEDLVDLPRVEDPLTRGILDLQVQSSKAYNLYNPGLAPTMILRDVRGVLQHGITEYNIQAWSGLGGVFAGVFGWVDLATRYSELTYKHLERLRNSANSAFVQFTTLMMIDCWTLSHADIAKKLHQLRLHAFETGSLPTAHISLGTEVILLYKAGRPFSRVQSILNELQRSQEHHRYEINADVVQLLSQVFEMMQAKESPETLEFVLPEEKSNAGVFLASIFPALRIHILLLFGKDEIAFAQACGPYGKWRNPATSVFRGTFWTYALVALFRGIEKGLGTRWSCRRVRRFGLKMLQGWVKHLPENREFRLHWVRGAELRSQGRGFHALEFYDKALSQALREGYIQNAAMIAEDAFTLCESLGHDWLSRQYYERAVALYREWGANAKVAWMLQKRPQLQAKASAPMLPTRDSQEHRLSTQEQLHLVDLQAVLKATEALSEIGERRELLRRLMTLVKQYAGAERGMLFLQRNGMWHLSAQMGSVEGEILFPGSSMELDEESELVSTAMLRFTVLSHEPVVLNNAVVEGAFVRDPYVLKAGPRSVLCLPIMLHNKLLGLLFLENRLSVGVFTQKRQDMLHLIATQAAVSLAVFQHQVSGEVALPPWGAQQIDESLSASSEAHDRPQKTLDEPLLQAASSRDSWLPSQAPETGSTVGDWLLIREMARGGMATIYEVRNSFTGQRAALKMMLPDPQADGNRWRRFEQEAQLLERLEHPNIVTLLDADRDSVYGSFFVMEYLEGQDLQTLLKQHAPLPLGWWLPLAEQLCDALSLVHEAGVLHRDLKPSNIVVKPGDPFPHLTLLDFGIAQDSRLSLDTRLTSTGAIVGTPAYLAPEQLKEKEELTVATDLYALGVLWFEALTGEHPMGEGSSVELFVRILQEEPRRLGDLRPEFKDSELEELLHQLLSKSPKHRPQQVDVLWNELSMSCQFLEDSLDDPDHYPELEITTV